MSYVRQARHRRRGNQRIDLAPLLDVIFNLIFFFILATTIREDLLQVELTLPEAGQSAQPASEDRMPRVLIDAQGGIWLDGQAVQPAELDLRLFKLVEEGRTRVEVHGDETVDFGRVMDVVNRCADVGIADIIVNQRAPESPNPEE